MESIDTRNWIWPKLTPGPSEPMLQAKCGFHQDCRFYNTYQHTQNQANRALVERYCRGEAMEECRIRLYFLSLKGDDDLRRGLV